MNEMRMLIQKENSKGEFVTVSTNDNFTGVVFEGEIPAYVVSASSDKMKQAACMLMGNALGRDQSMSETHLYAIPIKQRKDKKGQNKNEVSCS